MLELSLQLQDINKFFILSINSWENNKGIKYVMRKKKHTLCTLILLQKFISKSLSNSRLMIITVEF